MLFIKYLFSWSTNTIRPSSVERSIRSMKIRFSESMFDIVFPLTCFFIEIRTDLQRWLFVLFLFHRMRLPFVTIADRLKTNSPWIKLEKNKFSSRTFLPVISRPNPWRWLRNHWPSLIKQYKNPRHSTIDMFALFVFCSRQC